jgi:hypothetical protein
VMGWMRIRHGPKSRYCCRSFTVEATVFFAQLLAAARQNQPPQ